MSEPPNSPHLPAAPLEPALLAEVTVRAKRQLRSRMRALRGGHPAAALAERSAALVERLLALPELDAARAVASFWPMLERGEVDLRSLDTELRRRGVALYYPFMEPLPGGGARTGFRLSDGALQLVERGRGFAEPPTSAPEAARGEVDLVLVPALAVDGSGHRVGYGAGYYDATLGDVCPPALAVAVAYDFQLLAELPSEPHDRPCDLVVTDRRTLSRATTRAAP